MESNPGCNCDSRGPEVRVTKMRGQRRRAVASLNLPVTSKTPGAISVILI